MNTNIPKRTYTAQFREAAVRQVIDAGRSASEVARKLDISAKTLANWVGRARHGKPFVTRAAALQVDDEQAELSRLRAENAQLRVDNVICDLKKGGGVLCQVVVVKYAWIADNCARFPIGRMCALLGVSCSGFFAWRHRRASMRTRSDRVSPATAGIGASPHAGGPLCEFPPRRRG